MDSKSEPEGRSSVFGYDALGHLVSESVTGTGTPHIAEYEYHHPLYFKTKTTRRGGDGGDWIESRVLDGNGNATSIIDANLHETAQEFDDFDRVLVIRAPMGRTTVIGYDIVGNKKSETLGPRIRSWDYDDANRLIKATDGTGASVVTDYYPNGAVQSKTDGRGNVTGYTIDSRSRVTDILGPLGEQTHRVYDGKNNVTVESLPSGNIINHSYDVLDRLEQTSDTIGQVVKFTYDADGYPKTETDGRGNVTNYAYDGLGRKTSADMPEHRHRGCVTDRPIRATQDRLNRATYRPRIASLERV